MAQEYHGETIKVFLIDDHKSVLWGLQRLVESASPTMRVVGQATSWSAALPLVVDAQPDIILLDLDLGAESGLDAIPHFVQARAGKILVVTGMRDSLKHDNAVVAGARGVVEKEDSAETILSAIRKVHEGQIWLPRFAVDRILAELSKKDIPAKPNPDQLRIESLTLRERDVVEAVASSPGANARMIAASLFISEHTLRNHLTSIYLKLEVSSRLELYAFAQRHRLTKSDV